MHLSPLLYLAAALIFGILWQAQGSTPELALIFLLMLCLGFFAQHQRFMAMGALIVCFFLTGALRYERQKNNFELCMQNIKNSSCSVIAYIDNIESSYRKPGATVITATIQELKKYEEPIAQAKGMHIHITTEQPTNHLRVDDLIQCYVFLRSCESITGYGRYLIKEHLLGHVIAKNPIHVIERPTYSFRNWITVQRNALIEKIHQQVSSKTFTLIASIFFGKKEIDQNELEPIKENFKTWGILHYLARSGLHVLLFIALWTFLLNWAPVPFNTKQGISIFFIILYHIISWPSISFIRSLFLFLLYKICLINNLQIQALHLLALTCIIILLINPFQLFFLDFQLSFALTFALAWLAMLRKY